MVDEKENNFYIANNVGNRIKELVQENNISINYLAKLCKMPPSTIKNIVNGHSKNVGIVTINKICQGLEISLEEFFL